jgi:hypothetical protein
MKLIHPFLPISRAQLPPAKRREEIQAIQDDFKHTRQLSEKKVALSLVTYETVRTSVTLTQPHPSLFNVGYTSPISPFLGVNTPAQQ